MRRTVRCWLGTVGAAAAAAWVLGQGGVASAAPAAGAVRSGAGPRIRPGVRSAPWLPLSRPAQHRGQGSPAAAGPAALLPGPRNGTFDADTLEAVWAFKEVQGIPAVVAPDDVGIVAARALVKPRLPLVMVRGGGSERVEVNLTSEVLVLYRGGRVELISHISAGGGYYYPCPGGGTCGPAITPDGNYRARWFAGGWVQVPLGYMYDPVFFIGGAYAIHGDIPVPLQPVSHGCVRIPMDVAAFFHTLVHASESDGTPVYVRGRAPGT